eukprot:g1265.t1
MPLSDRQCYFYFYGSYKPELYWWECTHMATKSAMVAIAARASTESDTQAMGMWLVLSSWVILCSFALQYKYEAYRRPMQDVLVKVTMLLLLFLYMLAQALVIVGERHSQFVEACRAIASALMLLSTLGILFAFVHQYASKCRNKRSARATRKRVAHAKMAADPAVAKGGAAGGAGHRLSLGQTGFLHSRGGIAQGDASAVMMDNPLRGPAHIAVERKFYASRAIGTPLHVEPQGGGGQNATQTPRRSSMHSDGSDRLSL